MKFLKIFILLAALSTGIAQAQITKAELQVSGLTCALCAKSTEKALRTLPFIGDVKPDLARNIFVLTFNSAKPVDFAQISQKVQGAGFFVNSLKATFNFDKLKVADNNFTYGADNYQLISPAAKPLNGEVVVTLVDKGFAPKSVSKSYVAQAGKTGKLYHVAI